MGSAQMFPLKAKFAPKEAKIQLLPPEAHTRANLSLSPGFIAVRGLGWHMDRLWG